MARHKNIPTRGKGNLCDSDEDDFLGSSVEDSYSVSPDTAARYMYNPNRGQDHRDVRSFISVVNKTDTGNNKPEAFISPDDFPDDDSSQPSLHASTTNTTDSDDKWMPWSGYNGVAPKISFATSSHSARLNNNAPQSPSSLSQMMSKHRPPERPENHQTKDFPSKPSVGLPRAATVPSHLAVLDPPPTVRATTPVNTHMITSTPMTSKQQQPPSQVDRQLLLDAFQNRQTVAQEKPALSVVIIGHVDAGKSTLMGHLLYQLGQVDSRQMNRYQRDAQKQGKASFAFAWVLDQTEEERARGVTMDVAQTAFETAQKRVIVLDAPGHRDFIPRMITGTAQADAAILVINATRGEFESGFSGASEGASSSSSSSFAGPANEGQTREHAILARALGINQFIIAVNKMDTVEWSEERFKLITRNLDQFLRRMGSNVNLVFCPVSGLEGTNVFQRVTDPSHALFSWYQGGPCLLECIDSLECPSRQVNRPLRFTVSDVFKPSIGSGICVSGRIESGGLTTAALSNDLSRLLCLPSNTEVTVKAIGRTAVQSNGISSLALDDSNYGATGPSTISVGEQSVNYAFAGDYICLHLTCLQPELVEPGYVLSEYTAPVPCTDKFRAQLLVVQVPRALCKGFTAMFHCQSITATATLKRLHKFQGRDGKRKIDLDNPRIISCPGQLDVTIQLDRLVCVETNEDCRALGRFTLRNNSRTIAGGTVTKILKRTPPS